MLAIRPVPELAMVVRMFAHFGPRARLQLGALLVCALLVGICELVGVTAVVPLMAAVSRSQTLPAVERLYQALGWPGGAVSPAFWGGILLLAQVCLSAVSALAVWLGTGLVNEQQSLFARRLLGGYLARSYEWHLDQHRYNLHEMLARARCLNDGFYRPLLTLLVQGTSAVLVVGVLLWVDFRVTAFTVLILAVVFPLIYRGCRQKLHSLACQELALSQQVGVEVGDCLGMLKTIQLGGREAYFVNRYVGQVAELGQLQSQRLLLSEVPRVLIHLLAQASMVALLLYLQASLRKPELLVSSISLYALAFYRLLPCLQGCVAALLTLRSSQPFMEMLCSDLGWASSSPRVPPLEMTRNLVIRDLLYTYPGQSQPALEVCEMVLTRGHKVGIVGATGSGKTTLLNLLVGLLVPQRGTLELDGEPLSRERARGWQRTLGHVPQDIFLADAGLDANIAVGVEAVDRSRLEESLRQAALWEFIRDLPEGYATRVGENGIRLSGGQRQRVGIARALYHGARILILDEATNSLDSATEAEVLNALNALGPDRTVLVVAHRLSSVQDCDTIYLLHDGKLLARGSYAELSSVPEFQRLGAV